MPDRAIDVVIYHNPDCGTSRNTLAMIRNAGIEPHVVEYLKTPPARALLVQLLEPPAGRLGRLQQHHLRHVERERARVEPVAAHRVAGPLDERR